jgi:hypothetical protein
MLTSDVIRFLTVFGVFLLAFAQAFFILFASDGFTGFISSVQACFLAMLGDFVLEDYAETEFNKVAVTLLVIYVVVVTILLLNLLIAMMGSTYNKINEAAEMQWHLERARIVFAIEHEMGEEERQRKSNKYCQSCAWCVCTAMWTDCMWLILIYVLICLLRDHSGWQAFHAGVGTRSRALPQQGASRARRGS